MKIDFIIPASPNEGFYSQIALFKLGLEALGSPYSEARLVAVLGDKAPQSLPDRWTHHFKKIEVVWANSEVFKRIGYGAQGEFRYQVMRPDADLVVLCDADTLLVRPFEEDVFHLASTGAIGGVIAHYHFPWDATSGNSAVDWHRLSINIFGEFIDTRHRYTLSDNINLMKCPFYINFGFLVGSPNSLKILNDGCISIRDVVRDLLNNHFSAQVALGLAVAKEKIRYVALPMRYNFPNDLVADRKYSDELAKVRLLHYLRTELFDRQRILVDRNAFDHFLKMELTGSNRIFQSRVREITGGIYPFDSLRGRQRSSIARIFAGSN